MPDASHPHAPTQTAPPLPVPPQDGTTVPPTSFFF